MIAGYRTARVVYRQRFLVDVAVSAGFFPGDVNDPRVGLARISISLHDGCGQRVDFSAGKRMDTGTHVTSVDHELRNLWSLLSGVNSVVAVLLIASFAVTIYLIKPSKWWALAVLLDVSSFGAFNWNPGSVAKPLFEIQVYGRAICAALLVALLLPTVLAQRGWRFRIVPLFAVLFLIYEILISLLAGSDIRSVLELGTYVIVFVTLVVGVGRWLQTLDDADAVIKSISWAGILFLIGVMAQLAINPSGEIWNGRFYGTTGNPNHCGVLLAITSLATLYLMLRPGAKFKARVFYGAVAVVMVVLLLWTGSRTSMLTLMVGLVVQFRRRFGAIVVLCMVGAIVALAIWQTSSADSSSMRMFTTTNTRTQIWRLMVDEFMSSPLLGVHEDASGTENSYLLVAAHAGLAGLIPMLIALGTLGLTVRRVWKHHRRLQQFEPLFDVVFGLIAGELTGALFEGYLYGVYSFPVLSLYLCFALLAFLGDVDTVAAQELMQDTSQMEYSPDSEPGFEQYAGHLNY